MLGEGAEELKKRCRTMARKISVATARLANVEIVAEPSRVGGGALPQTELPGFALALTPKEISAEELAVRLRRGSPPVVVRIQEQRLLLNPRTVLRTEEAQLVRTLAAALAVEES
jgi:L-seryl-tRNA(Ser) seleniumtransferase